MENYLFTKTKSQLEMVLGRVGKYFPRCKNIKNFYRDKKKILDNGKKKLIFQKYLKLLKFVNKPEIILIGNFSTIRLCNSKYFYLVDYEPSYFVTKEYKIPKKI